MKNKFKIYNFEFGTLTDKETTIKIEMANTQFTYDSIEEIKNLPINNDPLFIELQSINESEKTTTFLYDKGNILKNLSTIKNESYPVKISIVEEILKQDILDKYKDSEIYISVNPKTMYYYPMETVRYTYVANRFMPRDNKTVIERYRACIVSVLSGIAYEKCLNSPDEVQKKGNDFIKEIYKQNNVQELLNLIKQSNNFVTYKYLSTQNEREKKIKKVSAFTITGFAVVFLAVGGYLLLNLDNREQAIASQYEEQLEEKDTLISAINQFNSGNYDEAIKLFDQVDYDTSKLAQQFIEKEEYQRAIDMDSKTLETVISKYYEKDEPEAVLELKGDSLDEKESAKLEDEKGIIKGDTNMMVNTLNFIDDENTAVRLARKFSEINDFNNVRNVLDKYPENESIQKIVETSNKIEEKSKQISDSDDDKQKETLTKELEDLKGQITEIKG